MKAVRGNIRSGGEAATENEGGSMRNIYKKAASLLLVTMILLSMVVTGAVAEAAAPTEVKSCEKSGADSQRQKFS